MYPDPRTVIAPVNYPMLQRMTQQGAALQTYNNELVKSLEELKRRRAALQVQIEAEGEEKARLEGERARVEERLEVVDTSLQGKVAASREYDRVIQEAEQVLQLLTLLLSLFTLLILAQAYLKILESSQVLLNVVQSRSRDLPGGKVEVVERRGSVGKVGVGTHITSTTPDSGYHQGK